MVVILKSNPDQQQLNNLKDWLKSFHLTSTSQGVNSTILGLVGDTTVRTSTCLNARSTLSRMSSAFRSRYKFANRKMHPEDTVVDAGGAKSAAAIFAMIAGPCSVESEQQLCTIAQACRALARPCFAAALFKLPHLALCVPGPARQGD